jgi:hypothetical protein
VGGRGAGEQATSRAGVRVGRRAGGQACGSAGKQAGADDIVHIDTQCAGAGWVGAAYAFDTQCFTQDVLVQDNGAMCVIRGCGQTRSCEA